MKKWLTGCFYILFLISLSVSLFWLFFFSGLLMATPGRNAPNRAALLKMRENLDVGATYADVLKAYWQYKTDEISPVFDGPDMWLINTPLEVGATNWVLEVQFEDGKAVLIRLRTSDAPPPVRGFPDKGVDKMRRTGRHAKPMLLWTPVSMAGSLFP